MAKNIPASDHLGHELDDPLYNAFKKTTSKPLHEAQQIALDYLVTRAKGEIVNLDWSDGDVSVKLRDQRSVQVSVDGKFKLKGGGILPSLDAFLIENINQEETLSSLLHAFRNAESASDGAAADPVFRRFLDPLREYRSLVSPNDFRRGLEAFQCLRAHSVLSNALPGVVSPSHLGITFSWVWVALHVISAERAMAKQVLYHVQVFKSLQITKDMYTSTSFQDLHSALDLCARALLDLSAKDLDHLSESKLKILIDWCWLKDHIKAAGYINPKISSLIQIVSQSVYYSRPSNSNCQIFFHSQFDEGELLRHLKEESEVISCASAEQATRRLIEVAKRPPGNFQMLVLAESFNTEKYPWLTFIPWKNITTGDNFLAEWVHQYACTEGHSAVYYPVLIRLPLWPHYSLYQLCLMVHELGFRLDEFKVTIHLSRRSDELACKMPYATIYFLNPSSLLKFETLLDCVTDVTSFPFIAKTWKRWKMMDYFGVKRYLVSPTCTVCQEPFSPDDTDKVACVNNFERHDEYVHKACAIAAGKGNKCVICGAAFPLA